MLLADSVRDAGYKVVLTGEGADEVFGGYDLFKEAARPPLLARGGPIVAAARACSRACTPTWPTRRPRTRPALRQASSAAAWIALDDRSSRTRRAGRPPRRTWRFFSREWRERWRAGTPDALLHATLPADIGRWQPLARDQYIEAHTLLSGYLLCVAGRPRGDGQLGRRALPVPRPSRHRVRQPAAAAAASCSGCARSTCSSGPSPTCCPPAIARAHQAALPRARQRQLLRRRPAAAVRRRAAATPTRLAPRG